MEYKIFMKIYLFPLSCTLWVHFRRLCNNANFIPCTRRIGWVSFCRLSKMCTVWQVRTLKSQLGKRKMFLWKHWQRYYILWTTECSCTMGTRPTETNCYFVLDCQKERHQKAEWMLNFEYHCKLKVVKRFFFRLSTKRKISCYCPFKMHSSMHLLIMLLIAS